MLDISRVLGQVDTLLNFSWRVMGVGPSNRVRQGFVFNEDWELMALKTSGVTHSQVHFPRVHA